MSKMSNSVSLERNIRITVRLSDTPHRQPLRLLTII